MEYEFEGRTEEEAIEQAAASLGLGRDEFDVEIVESQRGGFLKKGKTKIRVYTRGFLANPPHRKPHAEKHSAGRLSPENENKIIDFVQNLVSKMGYKGSVSVLFKEDNKLGLKVESNSTALLIGKKGKNLDALQLLTNVYAGKLGVGSLRVIIDSENYRIRREEAIVKMAYEAAESVRNSRLSVLLEPMNPFERRIVHMTLNDIVDIETLSEGEGLYKCVRIMLKTEALRSHK
jgi:spoIIIJ-associated protein